MSCNYRDLPVAWDSIEPYYQELLSRTISNVSDLEKWMLDRNALESFLQEDYAWRYIRMTCYTEDQTAFKAFESFAEEIEPKMAPLANKLDKKLFSSPFKSALNTEMYKVYLRKVDNDIQLFREENVPLQTQLQVEQQRYQAITGSFTLSVSGEELTFTQAAVFLKSTDRALREKVWRGIWEKRMQVKSDLNALIDKLIPLRHQVALNAGFRNYRDYMFQALGRFDYGPEDCFNFHEAVAQHVVPLLQELEAERARQLGLTKLRPWDMEVDPSGLGPIKPFKTSAELIEKTQTCFSRLHPDFGRRIEIMKEKGLFDIETRKGKAPGGYNYPLADSGMPFIFMHAAGTFGDMTTMLHEGGHALHTFESDALPIHDLKDTPSEVAELASMGMELLSMAHWDVFFEQDKEALRRAKKEQLYDVLKTLPWVACVDRFQHWLYLNPVHTTDQRDVAWTEIFQSFGGEGFCDWTGLEAIKANFWQKQLHIYEVPFYYIEYGMAQLGAIALWKNYLAKPEETILAYRNALQLGYTKTIPEIYATAGIRFDFSAEYVRELVNFVRTQIQQL